MGFISLQLLVRLSKRVALTPRRFWALLPVPIPVLPEANSTHFRLPNPTTPVPAFPVLRIDGRYAARNDAFMFVHILS